MAANPGAPPLGQPSLNADQIHAAYQQAFGRDASASELSSELENANKYSSQGILNSIAARTNNQPGSNQPGTATWAGINNGNPNVVPMSHVAQQSVYAPMPTIAPMQVGPMPAPMMANPTFTAPMSTVAAPQVQAPPAGYVGDPNNALASTLVRRRGLYGSY